MTKICVYIPTASFYIGGGEIVPLMQAKFLSKIKDVLVQVVTTKVENPTDYFQRFIKENNAIEFIYLEPTKRFDDFESREVNHNMGYELYYSLSRKISDFLLNNKPDYLITHYAPANIGIPASIKTLFILHGVPKEYQIESYSSIRLADKVAAVSESVSEGWNELFKFSDIPVLHNGIEESYFVSDPSINKDIDVFFVGRLIEIKGVQHLIEAIAKLKAKYPKINVVIGGEGVYKEKLNDLITSLDLNDLVQLIGYIPDSELLKYYQRSKICVFPSYAKEGVLTTMLEAASCSCGIITSDCCGMTDFIKDNINGLLFEPKNIDDLANKIDSLLENENLRDSLGIQARKDILANWTWDKSSHNLFNYLVSPN